MKRLTVSQLAWVLVWAPACGDDSTATDDGIVSGSSSGTTTTTTTTTATTDSTSTTSDGSESGTTGTGTSADSSSSDDGTDVTGSTGTPTSGTGTETASSSGTDTGTTTATTAATVTATDTGSESSSETGAPDCGNDVIEPPEECDDGNQIDGDGCSALCTLEALIGDVCEDPIVVDMTALPFSQVGDTTLFSNDYQYSTGVCPGETLGWNAASNDVVYALTPTTTGLYTVAVDGDLGFDSTVYVVTDCADIDNTCVAGAEATFDAGVEEVITTLEAGITYYAIAGGYNNFSAEEGTYTFTVDACVPTACDGTFCGDDGCGGTCGCAAGEFCQSNVCTPAPDGDTCENAIFVDPAALPFLASDDTSLYSNQYNYSTGVCPGEESGWNNFNSDVVYGFTPTTTGVYTITLDEGAGLDGTFYVVTDCADIDNTCVGAQEASNTAGIEVGALELTAGTPYFVIVGGYGNFTTQNGTYDFSISEACVPDFTCDGTVCGTNSCGQDCSCSAGTICDTGTEVCGPPPPGDTCEDPLVIDAAALPFTDSGTTDDYLNQYGFAVGVCPGETGGWNAGSRDVVYGFTPATTGTYQIVFDTTWDSVVYLVTDCADINSTCVAGADNGNPETITADLTAGTPYFIIGGYWSNTPGSTLGGDYTLTVSAL